MLERSKCPCGKGYIEHSSYYYEQNSNWSSRYDGTYHKYSINCDDCKNKFSFVPISFHINEAQICCLGEFIPYSIELYKNTERMYFNDHACYDCNKLYKKDFTFDLFMNKPVLLENINNMIDRIKALNQNIKNSLVPNIKGLNISMNNNCVLKDCYYNIGNVFYHNKHDEFRNEEALALFTILLNHYLQYERHIEYLDTQRALEIWYSVCCNCNSIKDISYIEDFKLVMKMLRTKSFKKVKWFLEQSVKINKFLVSSELDQLFKEYIKLASQYYNYDNIHKYQDAIEQRSVNLTYVIEEE